ncbi:MAG: hypothetical protein KGP28_03835 [Bdellovibrionales bacterium]|nr:hypothetical protein [Bdellovibrionales bacterium]
MFSIALILYLFGFGTLLFDARLREGYSLSLAAFGAILVGLSVLFFVAGILERRRLETDSHDTLP